MVFHFQDSIVSVHQLKPLQTSPLMKKKKKKGIYRAKSGPCVSAFTYLIPGTSHDLGLDARDWTCDGSTNTTVTYLNHIITVPTLKAEREIRVSNH